MAQILVHHKNSTKISYQPIFVEKIIASYLQGKVNADKLEISVWAVGEKKIKSLNQKFRNKDTVTDVLSFTGFIDEQLPIQNLGEIVFCPKVVTKQAKQFQQTFDQELKLYLEHSLDHLLEEYDKRRVNGQIKHHRRT